MKTAVEELSPTRVKLTIEVPFEELDHALDVTYKSLAKQVRIKGFRPGKAPAKLIDRYVGRGAVLTQAVNHAVPELYSEAVRKEEVPVLGPPEVEITRLEDGEQLAFTAEVDVRPKFEVTDYEGIEVTVDDAEVTEEQVNERLEALRQRFATLVGVDRPAEHGDHVSIDLSASIDGTKLEDAQSSGVSYEIGAGTMLKGLDEAIIGLRAGESTTFTTTLVGGEHKGREADVTVTVHSVKVKELPELDDEFARLASEFDTLEELRASEAERLGELLRAQQLRQARDRVLEKLVDSIDIPLPEAVITEETNRRRELLERQLSQSGLSKESYLEAQEKTEEEFEAELAENAAQAVKVGFVLDQLASQEKLTASNEELTQYVVEQAQAMGISPDQFFQSLMQANQLQLVYVEVVRAKALDLVVSKAKITDESGNAVEPPTPVHTETVTVASEEEETEEPAAEQGEAEK